MNRRKAISGLGVLFGTTGIALKSEAGKIGDLSYHSMPVDASGSVRNNKVFSDHWQFQIDTKDIGEKEQWFAKGFNAAEWSKVIVPRAWDTYEEALWQYEGIGWYALTIYPEDFLKDKRNVLRFNRVMFYSKVWINGEFVGENIGGYLPFEFDISRFLQPGQKNMMILRVDNKPRIEWLPGGKQIEWIQYGGILQKVELTGYGDTYIDDLTIRTHLRQRGALVNCLVTVKNDATVAVNMELDVMISKEKAESRKTLPLELKAGESKQVAIEFDMADAKLWSPETPVRYHAKAVIRKGSVVVDDLNERFGIREVQVQGTHILLNGKPLLIKGVNRYDDYGRMGPVVPEHLLREELTLMKSAGINFIRVHYPQSPDLLSLYDEFGFVMMEEVPLNWWGINFFGETLQSLDILKYAQPALAQMIRRDKNHPCLIIWSMANESGTNVEVGIIAMRDLLREAKLKDPTRLVTFVVSQSPVGHLAYDEADIVCVNMYNGIFSKTPCKHISDIEELGYKPLVRELTDYRRHFTTKPLYITEFGCAGIKGIHGDVSHTEEFQSAYIERIWEGIRSVDGVSGAVLWCWADYYHRKYFITYAAFGPYGVVTTTRKTKKSFETLKKIYTHA